MKLSVLFFSSCSSPNKRCCQLPTHLTQRAGLVERQNKQEECQWMESHRKQIGNTNRGSKKSLLPLSITICLDVLKVEFPTSPTEVVQPVSSVYFPIRKPINITSAAESINCLARWPGEDPQKNSIYLLNPLSFRLCQPFRVLYMCESSHVCLYSAQTVQIKHCQHVL